MQYKQRVTKFFSGTLVDMRKQQGFSLIELAVVLLVIGVLIGGASRMIVPYIEAQNYKTTKAKMEKIADALAIFAQAHYTLPCAADPHKNSITGVQPLFGMPMGSGAPSNWYQTEYYAVTCASRSFGAVPFRVLGLTEDDVTDAYGNLIAYAVSTVWDQYKVYNQTTFNVHRDCHTPLWKAEQNYNIRKAKFCCPANNGTVLNVRDSRTSGTTLFQNNFGACSPGIEAQWNQAMPSIPGSCTTPHETETIAFVLISRGREGLGAFLPSSGTKDVPTIPSNAQERGNIGNNFNFVSRDISLLKDQNYFDDIVVHRTNHQLISAFGNDSCAHP